MTQYRPRPWQPLISNAILTHARVNVFAGMGSGKTSGTLEALATLFLFGSIRRVLVIAPKRVATNTWPEALQGFQESFGWMTVAVAVGTPDQRHAAIKSTTHIVTINFDNLPWLIEHYGASWPFDMVVVDESTKLRGLRVSMQTHKKSGKRFLTGQGASRAKDLARVAHTKVKRWVNLTGTPALAGLEALWGQTWFVDAGYRLGTSFTAFSQRWFRAVPGQDATRQVIEPLPYADEQIRNAISDVSVSIDVRDWLPIAEPVVHHIFIDLPARAQRQYDEMARELLTEIEGHEVEAMSAGAKSQKLLQIASGAAYVGDQGEWVVSHDEKIEVLKSVIEEAGGAPVLVAYHFKSDKARITKAFGRDAIDLSTPAGLQAAKSGKGLVWLGHPQSVGHGVDGLQYYCNTICFFSTNWSAENDAQIIERVGPTRQVQAGLDRPVFVHRIIARGTVEESAVHRLANRVSVDEALRESLKKYRKILDCV